jgi:hypothetical protein
LRVLYVGALRLLWCDGRALAGVGGLDLVLEAPDFEPREVFVSSAELARGGVLAFALQPQRAKTLELRLVEEPPPGAALEARIVRPDGATRPWDFERHRGRLDARGRVRLEPAETGAFRVRLFDVGADPARDLGLDVPLVIAPNENVPPEPTRLQRGGTEGTRRLSGEVDVLYLPLAPAALE